MCYCYGVPELSALNPDMRELVPAQLERMLRSHMFRRKPRVSRFLEYTVQQTLAQEHARLKEYSIAVEVFGRPEDFDPRLDSIVRVEARRLRATVERYYETEGSGDQILIRYRRGNYIPAFELRADVENSARRSAVVAGLEGGQLMVGVLAGDIDYQELAGRQGSASVILLRPPLTAEALELLRSGDRRVVVLREASAEDLARLLVSAAHA